MNTDYLHRLNCGGLTGRADLIQLVMDCRPQNRASGVLHDGTDTLPGKPAHLAKNVLGCEMWTTFFFCGVPPAVYCYLNSVRPPRRARMRSQPVWCHVLFLDVLILPSL